MRTPNTGAFATGTEGDPVGSSTAGSSGSPKAMDAMARVSSSPSAVAVAHRTERLGFGTTRPNATRTVAVETPVTAAILANDKP